MIDKILKAMHTTVSGQDRSLMGFVQNYSVRNTPAAPPSGGSRDPFDFALSRKLQKPTADNNSSGYGSLAQLNQDDFTNKSEITSVRGVSNSVTNRARNGAPSGSAIQDMEVYLNQCDCFFPSLVFQCLRYPATGTRSRVL